MRACMADITVSLNLESGGEGIDNDKAWPVLD